MRPERPAGGRRTGGPKQAPPPGPPEPALPERAGRRAGSSHTRRATLQPDLQLHPPFEGVDVGAEAASLLPPERGHPIDRDNEGGHVALGEPGEELDAIGNLDLLDHARLLPLLLPPAGFTEPVPHPEGHELLRHQPEADGAGDQGAMGLHGDPNREGLPQAGRAGLDVDMHRGGHAGEPLRCEPGPQEQQGEGRQPSSAPPDERHLRIPRPPGANREPSPQADGPQTEEDQHGSDRDPRGSPSHRRPLTSAGGVFAPNLPPSRSQRPGMKPPPQSRILRLGDRNGSRLLQNDFFVGGALAPNSPPSMTQGSRLKPLLQE